MADEPLRRGGRFATTRWSIVLAAGDAGERSSEALASLCEQYWYPAYAFIRRQGVRAEDCADLTQAFFATVLEKNALRGLDPARGRFRAFLCAALRHFLSNERDRALALKRGGGRAAISLEVEWAEGQYRLEPRDELTPERLFDRQWALLLIERVLIELRQRQAGAGKAAQFEQLKGFLTGDAGQSRYADVAVSLGLTEGAIKVAVHRLRRQFRTLLVDAIAETVADAGEVDGEIAYLLRALSR